MSDKTISKYRYKFTVRLISIFLILTFFTTSSVGQATSTPIPSAVVSHSEILSSPELQIRNFSIPDEFGKIESITPAKNNANQNPVIIHIRDAHGSYEAQLRIKDILQYLQNSYGVSNIFLEGAEGDLDSSLFKIFKDEELNYKVADYLAKAGDLSGAELFLADHLSDKTLLASGVEDLESYAANFVSFTKVISQLSKTEKFMKSVRAQIEVLGSRYLNKPLKVFLKSWLDWKDERIDLMSFLIILKKKSESLLKIDLENPRAQLEYPALVRFFKLRQLEPKIQLGPAKEELEILIDSMKSLQGFDAERSVLRAWEIEQGFHGWHGGLPRQFLENLYGKMEPAGFDFDYFPNLAKIWALLIFQSELQGEALFQEIENLTGRLFHALIHSNNERLLFKAIDQSILLEKLLRAQLSRSEMRLAISHQNELNPVLFVESLSKWRELPGDFLEDAFSMQPVFDSAVEFYQGAVSRERHLIDNTVRRLKEHNARSCALVTGGFHSEGLRDEFIKKGYSFIEITPLMTSVEGIEKTYLESMLGTRKTIFEQSYISKVRMMMALSARDRFTLLSKTRFDPFSFVVADAVMAVTQNPAELISANFPRGELRRGEVGGVDSLVFTANRRSFTLRIVTTGDKETVQLNVKRAVDERLSNISKLLGNSVNRDSELGQEVAAAKARADEIAQLRTSTQDESVSEEPADVVEPEVQLTPRADRPAIQKSAPAGILARAELRLAELLTDAQIGVIYSIFLEMGLASAFGVLAARFGGPLLWPKYYSRPADDTDETDAEVETRSEFRGFIQILADSTKGLLTVVAASSFVLGAAFVYILNFLSNKKIAKLEIDKESDNEKLAAVTRSGPLKITEAIKAQSLKALKISGNTVADWVVLNDDSQNQDITERAKKLKDNERMIIVSYDKAKLSKRGRILAQAGTPMEKMIKEIPISANADINLHVLLIKKVVFPKIADYEGWTPEFFKGTFFSEVWKLTSPDGQIVIAKINHAPEERWTRAFQDHLLKWEEGGIRAVNPQGDKANFQKVLGLHQTDRGLVLVTALIKTEDQNGKTFPISPIDFLWQLAKTNSEIHDAARAHRDLFFSNVLVTQATNGKPVVAVLDLANSTEYTETNGVISIKEDSSPDEGIRDEMLFFTSELGLLTHPNLSYFMLPDRITYLKSPESHLFSRGPYSDVLGWAIIARALIESTNSEKPEQQKKARAAFNELKGLIMAHELTARQRYEIAKIIKLIFQDPHRKPERRKFKDAHDLLKMLSAAGLVPENSKSELRQGVTPISPIIPPARLTSQRHPTSQERKTADSEENDENGRTNADGDSVTISPEALARAAEAAEQRSELRRTIEVAQKVAESVFTPDSLRLYALEIQSVLNQIPEQGGETSVSHVEITPAGESLRRKISNDVRSAIGPEQTAGSVRVVLPNGKLARFVLGVLDRLATNNDMTISISISDAKEREEYKRLKDNGIQGIQDPVERGNISRQLRVSSMPLKQLAASLSVQHAAAFAEDSGQRQALESVASFVAFADLEQGLSQENEKAVRQVVDIVLSAAGRLAQQFVGLTTEERQALIAKQPLESVGFRYSVSGITILLDKIAELYTLEQARLAITKSA